MTEKYDLEGAFRLTPTNPWRDATVYSEDWDLTINHMPPEGVSSRFVVGFTITSDGKEVGEWRIPVRCELWKDVIVAKRYLRRGTQLTEKLFDIHSVDVLHVKKQPVPQDIDLEKYETAHAVSAGKPLFWNNIIEQPHIRKGQIIELLATEGNMRITAKGQALQNVLIGDFINVHNLQSRRDIQAQILDEKTVKVHF